MQQPLAVPASSLDASAASSVDTPAPALDEPTATANWDPLERASDSDATDASAETSSSLESMLTRIPPPLQEALQSHLMGTFVRVRPQDKRDLLFDEAATASAPDMEQETVAEVDEIEELD